MIISSGDINGGREKSKMLDVQEALRELRVPFYTTNGNNDVGPTLSHAWHEVFGRHSFSFAFRGVKFSFVDSASASVAPLVYDWLRDWLQDAGGPHILVTHIPPLDPLGTRNAGFRSRNEAAKFLNMLAKGETDLILCGHLHHYYDYELAGIPTVVSGPNGHENGASGRYLVVNVDPTTGSFSTSRVW